jgi:nucleoside phosphorylase
MIEVTFALPAESSDFISLLQDKRQARFGNSNIICGELGSHALTIIHTGVGRRSCEARINDLLAYKCPRILISSGFAGGVGADLDAGDLFLAENFSDPQLFQTAQRLLGDEGLRVGKLFTSSSIVDSAARRSEIAKTHQADAIDMETEMIARACAQRGIRMLSLRGISDTPRESFPVSPALLFDLERQKTPVAPLALHLLIRPGSVAGLLRFNRQISRARKKLTEALTRLIADKSFA